MPTYEYRCRKCGHEVEVVQSFTDDPLTTCDVCAGELRKVFSPVGISFKGSGFYKTDSRASSSSTKAAKADGAAAKSESTGDTKAETKTESRRASRRRASRPRASRRPRARRARRRSRRRPRPRSRWPSEAKADVGVIGGSGFYEFLDDVDDVEVDTPYGAPSGPVAIGTVGGRRVAFIPRHGRRHQFPPHKVPYRANAWALKELGVRAMLGPFAAGSLTAAIHPGEFVVVDQLVDRTWGRPDTFYDSFADGAMHVSLADPYDDGLRRRCWPLPAELGITVHDGGTVVVIQGPRFSTRAESRWYGQAGWHVIGMTQYPEAALAKELGLPYAGRGAGHRPRRRARRCRRHRARHPGAGLRVHGGQRAPGPRPAGRGHPRPSPFT